jgi:hypothetical protein
MFALESSLKITEVAPIIWDTFFHGKSCVLIVVKNDLGYILCDFFSNSSGHPAYARPTSSFNCTYVSNWGVETLLFVIEINYIPGPEYGTTYLCRKKVTQGWAKKLICQVLKVLRPILKFAPRGKFWPPSGEIVPQGSILSPGWGWSYPLGVKFSVRPSILLNSRECSPLGVNEGEKISPRGKFSLLGVKLTPRGEVHPWDHGRS